MIAFAALLGLGLPIAGWYLGRPSAMVFSTSENAVTIQKTPYVPMAKAQRHEQSQPFEIVEDPPYGPATAPEEMKELPTPAAAEAYLKMPRPQ
jgi:hypothetical protein